MIEENSHWHALAVKGGFQGRKWSLPMDTDIVGLDML